MQLPLVQIQDPQVKDTGHGVERSPRPRVWTVDKDANRPIFEMWFRLVRKDLRNGRTLPGVKAVTFPVGMLIQTLTMREMSMMTGTIIGQVLHRRVYPETLLIQVWRSVRPTVGI
jgi:hypothetical protein